jgi:hypothetical protein
VKTLRFECGWGDFDGGRRLGLFEGSFEGFFLEEILIEIIVRKRLICG